MTKIGLISDTHGYLDERIIHHLGTCDLVIHAGDIGEMAVMDTLEQQTKSIAVFGNIDGTSARVRFPLFKVLEIDGVKLLVIHIAGTFAKYNQETRNLIAIHKPNVLICGHSHILKVQYDDKFKVLYLNPGAAGKHGFHKVRTLLTFVIDRGAVKDLKVIELGPRSS
jgi:putative phosphoesterase